MTCWMTRPSEESLGLFHAEARVAGNAAHGERIYWIVPRNRHDANAVRHDDMLTLAHNAKARLLHGPDGIEVVDAGNLWHG
jgi:hypothetical protein